VLQHELPDVYDRAAVLLEPVDYLGMRLTGRAAATPASMILSWLTDNRVGAAPRYVADLVRRARRDPARLPPLRPTGSVLGTVAPDVAEQLGIAAVPVVCGIPDLHAAIVASGTVDEYETHYAVSTTAWFSARVPFKKTDVLHSIATVPGLDPDLPVVANNHETGGSALQWLREQVVAPDDGLLGGGSGIGDAGAAPEQAEPTYDDLTALAATAPAGCEGVVFAPWLAGERSPVEDKLLGAAFLNMSLRTDRATLVRAVLEGVAYNARWLFDRYQKFLGRDTTSIRIIGGGARSPLWNQIHADVLGVRVEVVEEPANAQLRGVALWARIALGELRLAEVPALVPVSAVHHPDHAAAAQYGRIYQEYQGLYKRLAPVSRRLNRPGRG
jgi:xylulokinase